MAPSKKDLRECFEPYKDTVTVRKLSMHIELRIGKAKPGETRYVRLTAREARAIGCALIALSEEIEPWQANHRAWSGKMKLLSEPYATDIYAGRRLPHPRHWLTLARLVGVAPDR